MSSRTSAESEGASDPEDAARPAHHLPDGSFIKPWLPPERNRHGLFPVLRWKLASLFDPPPPDPAPEDVPRGTPDPTRPRAPEDEVRITFIGHATFLVQIGGLNLLTDPVFSDRASPVRWMGPKRFTPPALRIDELPDIDAVLLSHDHYDHLDRPSVESLHARFGSGLQWITPLAYRDWFAGLGVERVVELDWWEGTDTVDGLRITAAPTQHWTRRGRKPNQRLWASYRIESPSGRSVYFGGDSGWWPGYEELGRRLGPHDALLLPIGAYEPRWFMRLSHMNPEDAVRAYRDMGGRGVCIGMHWGAFRLTDEPPLEPPARMRVAWTAAGLPEADLALPGIGGTVVVPRVARP